MDQVGAGVELYIRAIGSAFLLPMHFRCCTRSLLREILRTRRSHEQVGENKSEYDALRGEGSLQARLRVQLHVRRVLAESRRE